MGTDYSGYAYIYKLYAIPLPAQHVQLTALRGSSVVLESSYVFGALQWYVL